MAIAGMIRLADLVATGYLAKLFRRTELTITLWRSNEDLPFVVIPGDDRPAIRFELPLVRDWARQRGKRMYIVSD